MEVELYSLNYGTLSLAGFAGLELSASSSSDAIERSDMERMEVTERLPFCRGRQQAGSSQKMVVDRGEKFCRTYMFFELLTTTCQNARS